MNPPLTMVLFVLFWCWPISLLISLIGLIKKRPKWLILGAILYLPFALYLSLLPLFKGYPLLFPLFLVGASVALKKDKTGLAWLLFLAVFVFTIWVWAVFHDLEPLF